MPSKLIKLIDVAGVPLRDAELQEARDYRKAGDNPQVASGLPVFTMVRRRAGETFRASVGYPSHENLCRGLKERRSRLSPLRLRCTGVKT